MSNKRGSFKNTNAFDWLVGVGFLAVIIALGMFGSMVCRC